MAPASQTSKSSPSDKRRAEAEAPMGEKIREYFKGVRAEWHKVSWPTWPQIWGQTIVVLVMVSIMTLGLFIIDNSYSMILQWITPQRS